MKAKTVPQPTASLIALGVQTILTDAGSTDYRGSVAIHAATRPPDLGQIGDYSVAHPILPEGASYELWTRAAHLRRTKVDLPLGAVVATCTLVDVVPIVDSAGCTDATKHLCVVNQSMLLHSRLDEPWADGETEHMVSDQRPYGDFRPGRYAWLLADIQPTTARCPACWGHGVGRRSPHVAPCDGPNGSCFQTTCRCECHAFERCTVCEGSHGVEPIPARGRQGLWTWSAKGGEG